MWVRISVLILLILRRLLVISMVLFCLRFLVRLIIIPARMLILSRVVMVSTCIVLLICRRLILTRVVMRLTVTCVIRLIVSPSLSRLLFRSLFPLRPWRRVLVIVSLLAILLSLFVCLMRLLLLIGVTRVVLRLRVPVPILLLFCKKMSRRLRIRRRLWLRVTSLR